MSHPRADTPEIALIGATGTMGRLVLDELLTRRTPVRVLVRRRTSLLRPEIEQVYAPLEDEDRLREALRGIRTVFFISPHDADEEKNAANLVRAAEANGTRIVFAGVHVPTRTPMGWIQHRLYARLLPHYRGKLRIGRRIAASRTDPVIFSPTNFFQNDELFEADILEGRFPMPMRRMNRIDVRDLAQLCADALLDPDHPAGEHTIAGPESLSGQECADLWSEALQRPVAYVGDDDAEWLPIFQNRLSGQKLTDLVRTSRFLGRHSIVLPRAAKATTRLLGRAPRNYRDYVTERAGHGTGTDTQALAAS